MSISERENTIRTAVTAYFPMFIAVLSLLTSIYNGYLNNKFVNIIQGNLGRAEHMRTCKEIIDAYFQVKFRAGLVNESGERATPRPQPPNRERRSMRSTSLPRSEPTLPICATTRRAKNIRSCRTSFRRS